MNRGGVGSASIVLIFAVLCLAIFTMISYMSALADEVLIEREVTLVRAFYEADVLAEKILHEILTADGEVPYSALGVEITSFWDFDLWAEKVSFAVPISEKQELYVVAVISESSYEILTWRIQLEGDWDPFVIFPIFSGFDDNGGMGLFDPDAFDW